MIWALIGLLFPAGASWLWLRALRLLPPQARILTAAVAFAVGLGLSSLVTFWWAVLAEGINRRFALVDALIWIALAVVAWRQPHPPHPSHPSHPSHLSHLSQSPHALTLARGLFALAAVMAAAAAFAEYRASPYGLPDATLIWNLKARFVIRGGEAWTGFVQVPWASPSHPLLVPASVARLWAYAGSELTAVPALLGFAVAAAIVAAVVGALDPRRPRAWIAGTVLIAPWTFIQSIPAQTADLPFALYVVATLIVLLMSGTSDTMVLVVAGLLGGLAAWTKNEGLVFLLAATAMMLWTRARPRPAFAPLRGGLAAARRARGGGRSLGWWFAALAPALMTIACVKLALAPVPPEYLAETAAPSVFERLTDPAQHALVGGIFWDHWIRWGGPVAGGILPVATLASVLVASTRAGGSARPVLLVLALMLAAYVGIWIISPVETDWLVETTADRLLLQLWPSLVLATFAWDRGGAAEGRVS